MDCANVGECLAVAIRQQWEAFACGSGCYVAPDAEQREQDLEGLTVLRLVMER